MHHKRGLGKEPGKCGLEEIVMAIKVRRDLFKNIDTRIDTKGDISYKQAGCRSLPGIGTFSRNKAIVR